MKLENGIELPAEWPPHDVDAEIGGLYRRGFLYSPNATVETVAR